MMGAFGRFLEVSVPTADILRSLAFYRALGFSELATGEIRRWHYAVVTDGTLAIGLHGGGIDEPALAFVRPSLSRQVRALESAGQAFEFSRLGPDEFHEAALRSPDGHLVLMLEARTFSPGTEDATGTILGCCAEVTLACGDREATRGFFESAGFIVGEEAADGVLRLQAPGLTLGIRGGARSPAATLRFAADDARAMRRALAALDLVPRRGPEGEVLIAPEGTRLVLGG